jgi:hypothetical protein
MICFGEQKRLGFGKGSSLRVAYAATGSAGLTSAAGSAGAGAAGVSVQKSDTA